MTMWIRAAMSSTRRNTEPQIWDILLQNHHGTHKGTIPIKCLTVLSVLHRHISCIVAIPCLRSVKTGCVLHLWGKFHHVKANFVTILNSCSLNQSFSFFSGTDKAGGAGYSKPLLCISLLFQDFHLLFWSLSAPIIPLCFTLMSNFKLICSH